MVEGLDFGKVDPRYREALAIYVAVLAGVPGPELVSDLREQWRREALDVGDCLRHWYAQQGRFLGPEWQLVEEADWRGRYGDPWHGEP